MDSTRSRIGSQAAVVGNSFGAGLARLYAASHPERASHLILVDGGHIAQLPKIARRVMGVPIFEPIYERIRKQAFSESGIRRAFANDASMTNDVITSSQAASHGFVALMRQIALSDVPANQTPSAPTLLIWGERDRLAPLARAHELAAELPDARLAVIKNAGHMPQLEDPVSFIHIVREFCGVG
jgi:pimeloyl-ACP methyl ester carboxylesterase